MYLNILLKIINFNRILQFYNSILQYNLFENLIIIFLLHKNDAADDGVATNTRYINNVLIILWKRIIIN